MSEEEIHPPKCPSCSVVGKEHIVHELSDLHSKGGDPWFDIVHCAKCGHVYGVFNKVSLGPSLNL